MHVVRTIVLGGLAVASAMTTVGAATTQKIDCGPRDRHVVLLANDDAALYGYPRGHEFEGSLHGCTRDGYDLQLAGGLNAYARPPVMALNHRTVAVVTDGVVDELVVRSRRLEPEGFDYRVLRPRERIGALRVQPDGSMAWVSCPVIDEKPDEALVSPRPNCVRAGRSRNRVYLFTARNRKTRRVGSGQGLNPRSLRMSPTAVSWTRDGIRRRFVYRP